MEIGVGWHEIAIRLFWTVVGGVLIGINREEQGRPAGLRTILLVSLAASIAMIQTNLLMDTAGKSPDSFVVMDIMRLPLGILSGMGFIGAGAILRRDNLVLGVTTAATLWFVTVMGLCFGGGQIVLGIIALALGLATLSGMKRVEKLLKQEYTAEMAIVAGPKAISEAEIEQSFVSAGCRFQLLSATYGENGVLRELNYRIRWRSRKDGNAAHFLNDFAARFCLQKLDWRKMESH